MSFLQGLERLTKVIFARALPKRLGNHNITGPMLAVLATQYVEAINEGAVPTIATAWQVCACLCDAIAASNPAVPRVHVLEWQIDRSHCGAAVVHLAISWVA